MRHRIIFLVLPITLLMFLAMGSFVWATSPFSVAADRYYQLICRRPERTAGMMAFLCDLRARLDESEKNITDLKAKIASIESQLPTPTPTPTPIPPDDGTPFEASWTVNWNGSAVTGVVTANKPLKTCRFELWGGMIGVSGSGAISGNICTATAGGSGSTKFGMEVESVYGQKKAFGDLQS